MVDATIQILEATGVPFMWRQVDLNAEVMSASPSEIPGEVIASIAKTSSAIKGPISTPVGDGFTSPNVLLRQQLGLFASVRPARTIPGISIIRKPIDVVVVRENTEDVYVGIENEVEPGKVVAQKIITAEASRRVARCAFELAKTQARKQVTAFHKADILKKSDGLFLRSCREVAQDFPEITYTEAIVDSACMQLILEPERFDVIVAPNMYGDIVSDIAAGLIGGVGLAGSMNVGEHLRIYEAVHGSAPDIAGRGVANPTGLLMASVMMLHSLGEHNAAGKLDKAILKVIRDGRSVTPDLGGSATTTQFKDAVITQLRA